MKLTGRIIMKGKAQGVALTSSSAISFFGGVDPDSGVVIEHGHELEGKCIANKILVFPGGKGSTVGSYIIYRLKKNQLGPAAIINRDCEPIIAVGCIIADIPCIDQIDIQKITTGDYLIIDDDSCEIQLKRS
jgi:hypothetical protein